MASLELTPVFNVNVSVSLPTGMGPGNEFSDLTVINGKSGYVETIDGKTRFEITSISDWMVLGQNQTTATVDARMSSVGPKGINLDMHYLGKFKLTSKTNEVVGGTPGASFDFGEEYLYITPRISSRSAEFGWVNNFVFVGMGKVKTVREGAGIEISYLILRVG
ncbi:hypothetical protein B0J13DRAFT_660120 [Dactylonectria estremocensis]|uniref:Uncharacterized protein n=1 Tax=Dactylonectria estremocensis TaxID=1079267 RepID=A0A9P9D2D2_9HYPO|nr:hypothetical protein B0J13DRAFT_660120 [Dactylonectria estremocensis]